MRLSICFVISRFGLLYSPRFASRTGSKAFFPVVAKNFPSKYIYLHYSSLNPFFSERIRSESCVEAMEYDNILQATPHRHARLERRVFHHTFGDSAMERVFTEKYQTILIPNVIRKALEDMVPVECRRFCRKNSPSLLR